MNESQPSGSEWHLGFAMPNLRMQETFEFGDIAIVGGNDPRIGEIMANNAAAKALLLGFSESLGPKGVASGIIFRNPDAFSNLWSAMVDARNCVAVATVCFGWITSIGRDTNFCLRYSDHFDFYPRWPHSDGKSLVYHGAALSMMSSDASKFRGGTHPYIATPSYCKPALERDFLKGLTKSWQRTYVKAHATRTDRSLMRALSVAYEACRVPQAMDNPIFDHGKHCSLWVSAFETLAHPGKRVGLNEVLELISKRALLEGRLQRRVRMRHGKKLLPLNAAQRLYLRLYNARNAFLHGNRITARSFVPSGLGKGVRLLDTAPLVFYTALEAIVSKGRQEPLDPIAAVLSYKFIEDAYSRALGYSSEEI